MTSALLWDHDGVLVDTERLYLKATREQLAKVGIELSDELYRRYLLVDGTGAFHLAEQRGVPAEEINALKALRNRRYSELLASEPLLFPGVLALLKALARRYRMAIVTSSLREHFDTIHRTTGLPDFFELILTRECYERSKPDPEPYLTALTRMGLRAEQCLVIEDSERGLRAAKAAGLRCWVLPSSLTRGSSFEAADRLLDSHEQLFAALSSEL